MNAASISTIHRWKSVTFQNPDSWAVSASEMTYIVSSGTLNSTHSPWAVLYTSVTLRYCDPVAWEFRQISSVGFGGFHFYSFSKSVVCCVVFKRCFLPVYLATGQGIVPSGVFVAILRTLKTISVFLPGTELMRFVMIKIHCCIAVSRLSSDTWMISHVPRNYAAYFLFCCDLWMVAVFHLRVL